MLTLHFFGKGYGESILIKLPNGNYGVIDCYTSSISDCQKNPIAKFLTSKDIKRLEFICLTHPHDDHYKGLGQIIEKFADETTQFWRFCGNCLQLLQTYAEEIVKKNEEETLILPLIKNCRVLNDVISKFSETGEGKYRLINPKQLIYEDPDNDLEIWGVSPSEDLTSEYESFLLEKFKKTDDLNFIFDDNHNKISAALLLKYGKSRVLLGADTEINNWKILFNQRNRDNCKEPMHLVKVSHHGSEGAIYDQYWEEWRGSDKPVSIIIPFHNGDVKLPTPEGVSRLSAFSKHVKIVQNEYSQPESKLKKDLLKKLLYLDNAKISSGSKMVSCEVDKNGGVQFIN